MTWTLTLTCITIVTVRYLQRRTPICRSFLLHLKVTSWLHEVFPEEKPASRCSLAALRDRNKCLLMNNKDGAAGTTRRQSILFLKRESRASNIGTTFTPCQCHANENAPQLHLSSSQACPIPFRINASLPIPTALFKRVHLQTQT